jgi:hypothetical protein
MYYLNVIKLDLNIAYDAMGYTCMIHVHISSVSSIFSHMLQVFQLDVSKVDLGEHM